MKKLGERFGWQNPKQSILHFISSIRCEARSCLEPSCEGCCKVFITPGKGEKKKNTFKTSLCLALFLSVVLFNLTFAQQRSYVLKGNEISAVLLLLSA